MAALIPNARQQFLDSNGAPLVGGYVYMYVPGTTTPQNTWVDSGLTTLNQNPINLDSAGRCSMWASTGTSFRQVVTDLNGNLQWDQITSI